MAKNTVAAKPKPQVRALLVDTENRPPLEVMLQQPFLTATQMREQTAGDKR